MSEKDSYADKHTGQDLVPAIADKLKALAVDGSLTCASAHRAAKELGVSPTDIGIQADLLELRIAQCQLGLFGSASGQKNLDPAIDVPQDLWTEIESKSDDGRLSCRVCWEMAASFKMKRLDMGSACEKLGVRIKPCQLGAF